MGLVADIFTEDVLAQTARHSRHRTHALLHRRRLRAAERAAHHRWICNKGMIALAHNGNLVNASEFARNLERAGLDLPDHQRHRSRSCT